MGSKRYLPQQGREKFTPKQKNEICKKQDTNFKEKFLGYKQLRNKAYRVTYNIKFSYAFALNVYWPRIVHVTYINGLLKLTCNLTAKIMVRTRCLPPIVGEPYKFAVEDTERIKAHFASFEWWRV